jgi:alkylresorcinol/alkylpyrone synthase
MRIAGVASAFPQNFYSQAEIAAALKWHSANEIDRPGVLDRMLARVGVTGRHLTLPIDRYDDLIDWGDKNDRWIEAAEDLAEQAICRSLTRAGLCEADLDVIFFVSVTGIASPSVDARLINRMNLRPNIKRIPIFGLGCVAGAAGIARAADYVRAYPDHNAY